MTVPTLPPAETCGCTVGTIPLRDGLLFFKNRDLAAEYHVCNLTAFVSTPGSRVLKGVDLVKKELNGVSIGVNRRKVCVANTHVASTPDVPYDVLCEWLVAKVRRKSDVRRVVRDFTNTNVVQGGRILVASPRWTVLVEVLGREHAIEEVEGPFVITNHFTMIQHQKQKAPGGSSLTRLETATNMAREATDIRSIKAMLRSHVPEKGGLSICNHAPGAGTESSHIIHIQGSYIAWSSLSGYPCENDYQTVQLFME
ncbi:MAG: hypothetical protein GXP25_12870 [Planctomycetes bacterium]|nr:hypothetical protein [Planctomycetota bacterium]